MKTLLLLTSLAFTLVVNAKHRQLSLESATKLNLLKFKIKGTGNHQGKCLNLQLESACPDSLWLTLEAGCRLDSKNEAEQDILVTQEQIFVLGGFQKATTKITGYCCQATNSSPEKNADFTIGKPTDKNLVSIARYLSAHPADEHTTQSAVWCVSNKKPLASIPKIHTDLRAFVSTITGEPLPWYEVEYNTSSNNVAASQQANKVFGYIDYKLEQEGKLKIELRDSKGRLVMDISNQKYVEKGEHDFWFEMQVSHYPKGKYYLHFLSADGHVSETEIQVIQRIANLMGVPQSDYDSLKNMFYRDTNSDYKVLGIESTATEEEIKKAYRQMAIRYHPDKVAAMGDEYQKGAQEKFQKIQEAYENIKKQRGIN